jgi:hypothetical protein
VGQLGTGTSAVAGAGSTSDVRPIPGWSSAQDAGVGPGVAATTAGAFGPQAMDMYGASANYKFDIGDGDAQIYIGGEYGHTEYKPNRNSRFSRSGDAFRVEIGANLLDGDLDLSAAYLNVDPTYDPFVLQYPGGLTGAWRLPDLNYFSGLYSLHDTKIYPHNREGFRFNGQWRFNERRGLFWAKAQFLRQKRTSMYDVLVAGAGIAPTIPTNDVVGHSPGFIDPVFMGLAHPNVYGLSSANSFNTTGGTLTPVEDPRGRQTGWGVGVSYKFDDPRVKLDLGFEQHNFFRASGVAAVRGGSQNQVDLEIRSIHGEVGWEASDQWTLRAGADYVNISGHYDPSGVYNQFAISQPTAGINFNNISNDQIIPFIGTTFDVSANTSWDLDLRFFDTRDNVAGGLQPVSPGANGIAAGTLPVGTASHPFRWNGYQVTTSFKVRF